jgi:hypothetical protein
MSTWGQALDPPGALPELDGRRRHHHLESTPPTEVEFVTIW